MTVCAPPLAAERRAEVAKLTGAGRMRVAFQGAFGAFSHEACLACLPEAEPVPYATFTEAFEAASAGACELACIPVDNSIAGPVPEVAELLATSELEVRAKHPQPIRMQLMAPPGALLGDIRTVASHPMALKQCGAFLRAHGLEARPAYDTAGAAAALARDREPGLAVVAAQAAADLYGLAVLAEDVQDQAENVTRFLILGRARARSVQAESTSPYSASS